MAAVEISALLPKLNQWQALDDKLHKRFEYNSFLEAMAFVQKLSDLAEAEGHHPDFCVHYNIVDVSLWTHAIAGLSENDFIIAAKIDGF